SAAALGRGSQNRESANSGLGPFPQIRRISTVACSRLRQFSGWLPTRQTPSGTTLYSLNRNVPDLCANARPDSYKRNRERHDFDGPFESGFRPRWRFQLIREE